MDNNDNILYARTTEAYKIKILLDILCNTIKQSFLNISENGIEMTMSDQFRNILISFELVDTGFDLYKFTHDTDDNINVSITTAHLYKMLKTCKKKDTLEFYILKSKPTEILVKTRPRDNTRVTTSIIHTSLSPNIKMSKPQFSKKCNSIKVPSSDFGKIMKDMALIGSDTITISTKDDSIRFEATSDGILARNIVFGNELVVDEYDYKAVFSFDRLSKLTKISALGDYIQFQTEGVDIPLKLKTRIGDIGSLEIYIKSNDIITKESK